MTRPAVRTVVQVTFGRPAPPRPRLAPTGRIPRVARLLALAHRLDRMINDGEIRDWAEAAAVCSITRARMSQVASLLHLAPAIQEAIMALSPITTGRDPITERHLRPIVAEPDWRRQLAVWRGNSVRSSEDTCRSILE